MDKPDWLTEREATEDSNIPDVNPQSQRDLVQTFNLKGAQTVANTPCSILLVLEAGTVIRNVCETGHFCGMTN